MTFKRRKIAMVGGGEDSFIGAIHRMALRLDDRWELVAGAFSSDPAKSRRSGDGIGINPDRVYGNYDDLIKGEKNREDGAEVLSIVTPNFLHFDPAKKALEANMDVVLDKPLTFNLEEAIELKKILIKSGRNLALTHTYAGYPAVMEASRLVREGKLGRLRKVVVQYPQGWLSTKLEDEEQKQASWRMDPKRSGKSCCLGDIGTHALHLAETITGKKITELLAELSSYVEGRDLDDDASLLLHLEDGVKGVAVVSQISSGEGNALEVSVYGDQGGLKWSHSQPARLLLKSLSDPTQVLVMGVEKNYLGKAARFNMRTPAGHPEGYIEAFANIYRNFALHLEARDKGESKKHEWVYPGIEDGVRGMAFIEAAVKSSTNGSVWTPVITE